MAYKVYYIYKGGVVEAEHEDAIRATIQQNHLTLWSSLDDKIPVAGYASGWWFRFQQYNPTKAPTE